MFRTGIIGALVVCILALTTFTGWSSPAGNPRPENSQSANGNSNTNNQQVANSTPPRSGGVINNPTYYLQPASNAEKQKPFYEQWDFWVATATLALVIVTFALAVPAWWALDDSRVAHQRELRAYISVKTLETVPVVVEKGTIIEYRCQVIWQNTGKTPAIKVNTGYNGNFCADNLPNEFDFPDSDKDLDPSLIAVGPDQVLASGRMVSATDLIAVFERKKKLFVWAWIEYADVFSCTKRHRTETCFEVLVLGDPTAIGTIISHRYSGVYFNGMDEECYRQPKDT